jgi:hypothetical protein
MLAVYNGELYAGGYFDAAHGDPGNHIAKWNGSSWSAVGSGLDNRASALLVYDGELYVGGSFTTAGGVSARGVAKWNGVSWSAVGSQDLRHIYTLALYNGNLYAGGEFFSTACEPQYIARFVGNNWVKVGDEVSTRTRALVPFNGDLIAGGDFASTKSGITALNYLAKYHPGTAPDFLNASAGPDAHIYIGYTPTNCISRTASASGGTPPYSYSWTLNRPLLCNSLGNESFSAEACVNISCGSVCVDEHAVSAHLAHGDTVGPCP